MYSAFTTVFIIGTVMILVGFVGRLGTDGISDISKNVASSLGLLVTYVVLIVSLGSPAELAKFFEGLCGGIPFVSEISEYGSMQQLLHASSPMIAVTAFMDTVILSAIIELIMLLPLGHNQDPIHFFTNVGNLMTNLFVAVLSAIAGLLLLNYVIKPSAVYQWIVSGIGSIITIVTIGSVPLLILSLAKSKEAIGAGVLGGLLLFSKSKIIGVLRSAFLKAVVYVIGIWMLEKYFGSISNGLSRISVVLLAFGPLLVMVIGLGFIIKAAFSR